MVERGANTMVRVQMFLVIDMNTTEEAYCCLRVQILYICVEVCGRSLSIFLSQNKAFNLVMDAIMW